MKSPSIPFPLLILCLVLALTTLLGGLRLGASVVRASDWTLACTGALVFGLAAAVLMIVGAVMSVDRPESDRAIGLVLVVIGCGFIVGMSLGSF